MLGGPSGAVARYDEVWGHLGGGGDGAVDDGLEGGAAEVEAAKEGMEFGDVGEPLGVPDDVDGAGASLLDGG